ncbi:MULTISPECIES: hypothetical protein [unclassified Ruegeria]|uniref:hypothetical protein n=1 Tax=unclassified Ruegeria TaxID=2625375 RepID=UPI00148831DA|nr:MULTISPECIES: hypothetical protein [unclassified Ruegeria]NOC83202.1 hypothetical protein [Ruegeria sp. HKCCD6428]
MRRLICGIAVLFLSLNAVSAASVDAEQAYDLLFQNGVLDTIERDKELIYQRTVTNRIRPDAAERDTGLISLSFSDDGNEMAHLEFRQDDKHRAMGVFPASVGNPMIMVFYESAIRDMAESAGGSPFYIRNRIKDALVQPAEIVEGEAAIGGKTIPVRTIFMRPFAEDPNRDRMQGFGDLVLRVTVSEEVPGWYLSLVAEAVSERDGTAVYRSEMRFEGMQEGRE